MRAIPLLAFLLLSCGGPLPGEDMGRGGALGPRSGARLLVQAYVADDGAVMPIPSAYDTKLRVVCAWRIGAAGRFFCVPQGTLQGSEQWADYVAADLQPVSP